ncbi:MAG TPA: type I-F CRISPR-associated helicase Cas3f [Hydrogenophilus thermoluteolus]|nr:type I-F CRISPR-associated helicase Cas3f [Hydrogenophilus thermoluteolus]
MNVLFVSQCSGNALTQTRRILDQFAERRGERSWVTPITWEGLKTVYKLLRQSARKNTAVACFWLHRNRSELMWIVGDARRFNERGTTPTNTTTTDILRYQDENDWRHGETIRLLASLAALFHDFGKASAAFQKKLQGNARTQDALRHEWVSLQLFATLVGTTQNDRGWLDRIASEQYPKNTSWPQFLAQEALATPLQTLPPLAQAVGWLILTHHRLPVGEISRTTMFKQIESRIKSDWGYAAKDSKDAAKRSCWLFDSLPWHSAHWRHHAARLADRLLKTNLHSNWLDDPYVLHLARLTLTLADHFYSSQPSHPRYGEPNFPLYANTDTEGKLKQRLDEHLIGVEVAAGRIAQVLPHLHWQLPRIARHRGLRRPTRERPFLWQNKAFELAENLRPQATAHGFFGINLASTGCGKTLANARILYGLADPHRGARFTVALGLRTLTLQTGDAYRERLGLGSEDLAVLVGGGALRALHEHRLDRQSAKQEERAEKTPGSESGADLLLETQYVHFEGSLAEGPLRRWLEDQPHALVQAPIVVCTVDHLVPATESLRGGGQILPMLRLLTSDLVLDEVDDFDVPDLPALTRLVHWAGMLGSRILLSSATLPPALVCGLFQAYLEGRKIFQSNRGEPGTPLNVCCAWFDEFGASSSDHAELQSFAKAHEEFVAKRLRKLKDLPQRRRAAIKPLTLSAAGQGWEKTRLLCEQLAQVLRELAIELHQKNHQTDPQSGKRISVGLVRMANIDPLVATARALLETGMPENCRLHLCVYHAQFPLYLRAAIEARLDRLLKRHDPHAIFCDAQMRALIDRYPEPDQIFLVMATPVAEVGRDHDYDWAIVEPSSMRSIIQLAGRIRRHRLESHSETNLYLLSTNLRSLRGEAIAYCKPGYESQEFRLTTHDLRQLLREEELTRIDAAPRISEAKPLQPANKLADLEHAVLRQLMLNEGTARRPVTLWWETHAHLSGVLQSQQRFRAGQATDTYLFLPSEEGNLDFYRLDPGGLCTPANYLLYLREIHPGPRVGWWSETDALDALEQLAKDLDLDFDTCARRFATVELQTRHEGWWYHPGLGLSRKREE